MKKNIKKQGEDWVDVHDDALMVKLGIRYPDVTPRDPEVWTKTPKEKKLLKKLRCGTYYNIINSKWSKPINVIPIYGKLIIYTHGHRGKAVYSSFCGQHEIPLKIKCLGRDNVIKYNFCGLEYSVDELPFWYK